MALRHRPNGQPVMHQNWGKLLFMHWRVDEELLRPLVPEPLSLDLYGGNAWIGIAPFTMWDVRAFPPFAPPVPGLDSMHELNVRTYVHYDGEPGVWFFSLDVNSELAAAAARTLFFLPYHTAKIDVSQSGGKLLYQLRRQSETPAHFQGSWSIGKPLPVSAPGTREFFLTERYCLYTANEERLYRARIHHQPWPLQKAKLHDFDTNLFEANRLPIPKSQPIVHYAEQVNVDIWYLERVLTGDDR